MLWLGMEFFFVAGTSPKLWFLPLWKGLFQAITSIMTGEQIVIYLT